MENLCRLCDGDGVVIAENDESIIYGQMYFDECPACEGKGVADEST